MRATDENLCIFSHFDRHSQVREYVHHYVQCLVSAGFRVIFVSTADRVGPEDRDRLEAIGVEVHTRENKGLDFGSWQYGLRKIKNKSNIDKIVLANDSVFGPLFDLNNLFRQMEKLPVDFWGITDSYEKTWHLQSYFLCFNRKVLDSEVFGGFFEKDFLSLSKQEIIAQGEVTLSQELIQAGFHGAASCPYNLLVNNTNDGLHNPTHYYWDRLIEQYRCPFLKIQLLRDNPRSVTSVNSWRDVISRATDYDILLIEDHLASFGEAPPRRSPFYVVHWWATKLPYLFKLLYRTTIKAAKHPIRAVMGLERFLEMDPSKLPPYPAPRPTTAYSDLGIEKSSPKS